MENLKVTKKYRFSLSRSFYIAFPCNLTLKRMNQMDRLCRFIDKVKLFLHYIPSCIGGKRISYAAWKGSSFERDEKRKGGKLTRPSHRLIPFLPSFYSYDRVHPSIALWESKDVFRENEDLRRADCSSMRGNAISPFFIFAVKARFSGILWILNPK